MSARLRPVLVGLPVYVPGKTVPGAIKLASNETVFGPLPSVRAAIERATDVINRYPDNGCVQLKAALAKHLGSDFAPEHVAVGCGSVSLCQQLVQIAASAGDEVIFGWRSFELYPPQVQVAGAIPIQVPLIDHTYDLYAMLAAVTDRTRLIFVCNPNNPTSTVVFPDALVRFVEAVPPHVLIAIDEAYVEYIRDGMLPGSLELVRTHSNVVVLRTFSKAYGLAGLRVGYAVGHPDVTTALDKVYVPFNATSLSQAAAIASLDAADELLARTDAVVAERTRVSTGLREAGFALPSSQANFVWLPLGPRTRDFVKRAADARIVVRPYGTDGVRVTIGAPEENDAFLEFARGFAHNWNTDQRSDPMSLARKKFTEFKQRSVSDAELDDYWASLEPATIDGMIGEWKGGEFSTGHKMNGKLEKNGWFGKTFKSATDAQPLVCLDADGNKFSNVEWGKGEASLWLEDFRGEVTATMVYDGQPVHDHFKQIDDHAVMGIMNGKGVLDNGRYYYFYLERV